MSEHNAALLKKFQGNGWAVTCSPASQNELSAILSDSVAEESKVSASEFDEIGYKKDWADAVLHRSMAWKPDDAEAPLWLSKATEGAECALFQLPAPDHRWVVKFAGKILEPFNYRMAGWPDLHEIMVHGFILDRTALIDDHLSLARLRRQRVDVLRGTELIRPVNSQEYGYDNRKTDDIFCSVTGARLHGLNTQTEDGKIDSDRWRTCADDFHTQLRKRLDRVLATIRRKDELAAHVMQQAIHFRNGTWSFSDSRLWMTKLGDIPYDAKMVLTGKNWEIDFPNSSEPLVVPDSAGMRAIARVLMCNNIPCPCALVVDGSLLNEFLGKPRHHKYFDAIYRRPRVECGDPTNDEVERSICTAMRLKPGWCYVADHVISEESALHTVCGIPTGKVSLKRADALEGVRDLIKSQQAKLFFCSAASPQFTRILSEIEAGIEFARKQEKLLDQVQPKSEEYQERIQKAIYRARTELQRMGDWTTRYDRLADHFSEYIKAGLVLQYTGPYRWKIEGLPQTPDTLDLAADHREFKRSKVGKAMRRAKAKMRAMQSLNLVSRGTAGTNRVVPLGS